MFFSVVTELARLINIIWDSPDGSVDLSVKSENGVVTEVRNTLRKYGMV